jgi:hypothetical protein
MLEQIAAGCRQSRFWRYNTASNKSLAVVCPVVLSLYVHNVEALYCLCKPCFSGRPYLHSVMFLYYEILQDFRRVQSHLQNSQSRWDSSELNIFSPSMWDRMKYNQGSYAPNNCSFIHTFRLCKLRNTDISTRSQRSELHV